MIIEINLLPWREQARERRSKHFYVALGVMAALGLGGGYGMASHYEQRLADQQQRNDYVRQRTALLDSDIRTIREYEADRERLQQQIDVFSELQHGRPQTVLVFNQLAASLEGGVHYTELKRQGDRLRLTGLAEDNRQVSDQLRALEASAVFDVPVLSTVESDAQEQRRFDLSVAQLMPSGESEEAP